MRLIVGMSGASGASPRFTASWTLKVDSSPLRMSTETPSTPVATTMAISGANFSATQTLACGI